MPRKRSSSTAAKHAKKRLQNKKDYEKKNCNKTNDQQHVQHEEEKKQETPKQHSKKRTASDKTIKKKKYYTSHKQCRTDHVNLMKRNYATSCEFRQHWQQKMRHKYESSTVFRQQWRQKMRQKYQSNTAFRQQWRQKMTQKYHTNTAFRQQWQQKMRQKYHSNTAFRQQWRQKIKQKYQSNTAFRNQCQNTMRQSRSQKYQNDSEFRQEWRQKMRQKYETNTAFRQQWRQKMREKYESNTAFRNQWRDRMRHKYINNSIYRIQCKQRSAQIVKQKRAEEQMKVINSEEAAVAQFKKNIQQGPIYTCLCCHRHLYKQTVIQFNRTKYKQSDRISNIVSAFNLSMVQVANDQQFWICKTCHSHLLRGNLPPQAAINGLILDNVPQELMLTDLEGMLVAQRIFFMRLLALPRGRQRAIHGAVVNVPSAMSSTVASLPMTPNEAGLVPLMLKRRLRYKGYVMYQLIRPAAVICAAHWLVHNNPLYRQVPINMQWIDSCLHEDEETWTSLSEEAELTNTEPTVEADVDDVDCLLWSADGPNMTTASDADILKFFSNKITGRLPDEESKDLRALVGRVQRHSHSVASSLASESWSSCDAHTKRRN